MKGAVSGTLFVVATPIGNLEDITLRALRVLREVALVAAEDTRRTGNLLRHYDIATPLQSLHEHNEHHRQATLVERLERGDSIALVSDAGTPGISDPGAQVVRAARDAGIRVEPVPGPSAVTAVLSASGVRFDRFAFAGFPPVRSKDRKLWFDWLSSLPDVPVVGFEAPHRIRKTLKDLATNYINRPIIIARELTKLHEEWIEGFGSPMDVESDSPRGEFVFVLGPVSAIVEPAAVTDQQITDLFGQITENGTGTRRAAIRVVAKQLKLSAKKVYAALERHKHCGN